MATKVFPTEMADRGTVLGADKLLIWNSTTGSSEEYTTVTKLLSDCEKVVNKSNSISIDGTSDTKYPSTKSVKTYVDTLVGAVADGSPKDVYATLAALQAAFPTGTTGIYVTSDNGHWYFWSGSVWSDGGVYQGPVNNVVQVVGESTTDVMSQKSITDEINRISSFADTFIRLKVDEKIITSPTKWLHNVDNCEVTLRFLMPASISATSYLLYYEEAGQVCEMHILTNGYLYITQRGGSATYHNINSYLGQICELKIIRNSSPDGLQYYYLNGTLLRQLNSVSPTLDSYVYIGCYKDIYGPNLATDYYYLSIRNLDTNECEFFNASSSFVELTATKYILGEKWVNFIPASTSFEDVYLANIILSGSFTLSSDIVVPENTHIRGNGCTVYCTDLAKITLSDNSSIEGISFSSNGIVTRVSRYEAHPELGVEYRYELEPLIAEVDIANIETYIAPALIVIDGKNASVNNCTFDDMYNYTAIKMPAPALAGYIGADNEVVSNCHFNNCKCAIDCQAEFGRIVSCVFKNCVYGLFAKSGNLNLSSSHFVRCDIGVVIADGGNGGHSQYTGCEWAHNGLFGIYSIMLPTALGLCITGCQFADAPIAGKFGGLCIVGSRIDSWFRFDAGLNSGISNMIHSCIFERSYMERDFYPIYGVGYLDYYFQLEAGTSVDLKNNISLLPSVLPNTVINN